MLIKKVTRRQFIELAGLISVSKCVNATPKTLPTTTSLSISLAAALQAKKSLLVMVSLDGCPFCKIAREHYLIPLHEQHNQPIVQINMRSRQKITDLNGIDSTHEQLIRSWGIKVAPTVLFLGRQGIELADRLSGAYIPDFYGAYLDERVKKANSQIII